jgi:hypothetical protein
MYHFRKICFSLLLVVLISACEKDDTPPTTMTVNVTGGATWTQNSVTTTETNDIVEITSTNAITRDYVILRIRNYQDGRFTYTIQNTGVGTNLYESSAYGMHNGKKVLAYSGKIAVTQVSKKTISGTFEFTDQLTTMSGTYTAPRP